MYQSLYGDLQTSSSGPPPVPVTTAQNLYGPNYQASPVTGFYSGLSTNPLFYRPSHSYSQGPFPSAMTGGRTVNLTGSYSQPSSPSEYRNLAARNSDGNCTALSPDHNLQPLNLADSTNFAHQDSSTVEPCDLLSTYQRQASSATAQQLFFPLPPAGGGTTDGSPVDFQMADSMGRVGSPDLHGIMNTDFSPLGPPVSPGLCAICQDRATGKHYGANSCDGCKGFFRRTVRKSQKYTCRFSKNCQIDRDKRNSCRYCRFKKCIHAGMRKDAVQNERDRINSKKASSSQLRLKMQTKASAVSSQHQFVVKQEADAKSLEKSPRPSSPTGSSSPENHGPTSSHQIYIEQLLRAEAICSQLRATVITRTADQMPVPALGSAQATSAQQPTDNTNEQRIATVNDVTNSMHQQLLLMVEWAKTLSPFVELNLDDQISLLRNYAAQHLLICVAYRSRQGKDQLFLTNETCLPREPSAEIPDVNHVTVRVLDELVTPIKEIDIDESEFVCLRAIVFFNPNARGLEDVAGRVRGTRQSVLLALNEYVSEKLPENKCRLGNLLLLLPPLQAIAQNLIEDIQLASLFGMARIDSLLQELLLSEDSGRSRLIELSGEVSGASAFLSFHHLQQKHSFQLPCLTLPPTGQNLLAPEDWRPRRNVKDQATNSSL